MLYREMWENVEKQIKGVNDLKQNLLTMQKHAEAKQDERLQKLVQKAMNTIDITLADVDSIKKSNMPEMQKLDMITKKIGENIYGEKK